MSRYRHPLKVLLLAALCAWPLATPASVPPHDAAPVTTSSREAAFDEIFEKVTGPGSMELRSTIFQGYLERLQSTLPAGDEIRETRFKSVFCASRSWTNATRALAYSDEALKRARNLRDVASQARAMLCRGNHIMAISGSQRGIPEFNKAVKLLEASDDKQLLAEALEMRGDTLSLLGEQARAMIDFQRARVAYRAAGIDHELEPLMFSIAVGYRRIGNFAQAERYFTSALTRMREKQDWEAVANNHIQLGFVHADSGAPDKAQAAFRQAIAIASRHADPYSVSSARLGLADTQIMLGDPEAALETLAKARAGFVAEKDETNNDMLLILTGQALASQEEHAAALSHYELALPLVKRNGNDRYLAMIYKLQAASQEALGNTSGALKDYKSYNDMQMKLQGKMRLEQSRMQEYESEIRRRDFENRQLRADAEAKQQQLTVLERVRHWQTLTLALGALLIALLTSLALRQWNRSRQLSTLTLVDPLTRVASRLAIENVANAALAEATRDNLPLSVLMLDLDHFKSINDRYGHAAGDAVLRAVAKAWQAALRGRDPVGRVGGEEFLVVCLDAASVQARVVAERLRESVTTLRFASIDPALRVTVSIGIAHALNGESRDALFRRADAALYRAKQNGRNRVET